MELSKHALTTIDTVKAEISPGEGDPALDALIVRMINSASDSIRSHCRRDFARDDITEVIEGQDWPSVLLSLTPVAEIESVLLDGIEFAGYDCIKKTGKLISHYRKWPANRLITIRYTGGYVTPQQVAKDDTLERDLPWDIEEACIMTAVTRFQQLGQPADIQVMQVEQIRVQFAQAGRQGLPETAKQLLEPFVRYT